MAHIPDGKLIYSTRQQFSKARNKSFRDDDVMGGALTGCTDTDYFYFLCPVCGQILQWNVREFWEMPSRYPEVKKSPCQHIELEIWCRNCNKSGAFKISNLGWQGGILRESGARISHPGLSGKAEQGHL